MSATSSRLRTAPTAWLRSDSPLCSGMSSPAPSPSRPTLKRSHTTQGHATRATTLAVPNLGRRERQRVLGERDQTGVQHTGARHAAATETTASVLAHQTGQLSGHRRSREAEERDQLAPLVSQDHRSPLWGQTVTAAWGRLLPPSSRLGTLGWGVSALWPLRKPPRTPCGATQTVCPGCSSQEAGLVTNTAAIQPAKLSQLPPMRGEKQCTSRTLTIQGKK